MKLVFFDAHRDDEARLQAALPDVTVVAVPESVQTAVAKAVDADIIAVFVDSEVTAEVLEQLPALKMIVARSAGIDHIVMDICRQRGIVVTNVPHYGERTVAEHTFALILALSRKIFQSYERTERMDFNREGLMGFDLHGKTLGVIGTGNIGRNVITIGKGFGMEVVAYDTKPDEACAQKLGFGYTQTVEELLQQSDVVTLHVPYLPSTHHLITKDRLAVIKRGALLINTARGGLIDTEALLWALQTELVAGAGLDVLEEEHDTYDRIEFLSQDTHQAQDLIVMLRNHVLVSRPDVIITPHNAFNSAEAVQLIFDTTIDNIKSFIHSEPINVVE